MLTEQEPGRSPILARRIGLPTSYLMGELYFVATMNIKEAFHLICISLTRTVRALKKLAGIKGLMHFLCSVPTGKRYYFQVTGIMEVQETPMYLLQIGSIK